MKLTEKHIEELYKFTRKHYVEYYDVQTELVDHLANNIEQIIKDKPNVSFEEARDISFKKFGVFGFMEVVDTKKVQMNKKYFKIIFKFIKQWFQIPKIIATILLFTGFYQLQKLSNSYLIYTIVFFTLFTLQIVMILLHAQKLKKKQQKTQKKWLFENIIQSQGFGYGLFLVFYSYDFFIPNSSKEFLAMGDFRRAFSAFLITFLVIFGYITLVVIPKKANQLLVETYPEYKLI